MALGRSDTAPRALGCAGGRDELVSTKNLFRGVVTHEF